MTPLKVARAKNYIERNADSYVVAWADESEIDRINILNSTMKSMFRCLNALNGEPCEKIAVCKCPSTLSSLPAEGSAFGRILVDGNRFDMYSYRASIVEHYLIDRGDATYFPIACASILAKYYRDQYIFQLAEQFPYLDSRYDIKRNKGYGTKRHVEGLKRWGMSPFHRTSFRLKNVKVKTPAVPPPTAEETSRQEEERRKVKIKLKKPKKDT